MTVTLHTKAGDSHLAKLEMSQPENSLNVKLSGGILLQQEGFLPCGHRAKPATKPNSSVADEYHAFEIS